MHRRFLLSSFFLVMILVLLYCLSSSVYAVDISSTEELIKDVLFHFSVVDYQYSITVENNTNKDIASFRIYDYQRMDSIEKGGDGSLRRYPVATDAPLAVPAGKSQTFVANRMIWRDCDNIVIYVYDIVFSDGTEWGTQYPIISELSNWALKYEVPFSFSVFSQKDEKAVNNDFLNRSDWIDSFLGLVFIVGVVFLITFLKKKQLRTKDGNSDARRSPKALFTDKGQAGEFLSYEKLEQVPGEKRLLHNIYVRKPNGTTTEIDCLLVHQNGLFVIESKNYKGYIYGSPNDKQWTQVLRKNRHYTFYNPVWQNSGHVKNLLSYLSYATQDRFRNIPVYSIIVFAPTADITKVNTVGLPQNTMVICSDQLVEIISSVISKTSILYSSEEITRIYQTLLPLTEITEEDRIKHIEEIHSMR